MKVQIAVVLLLIQTAAIFCQQDVPLPTSEEGECIAQALGEQTLNVIDDCLGRKIDDVRLKVVVYYASLCTSYSLHLSVTEGLVITA